MTNTATTITELSEKACTVAAAATAAYEDWRYETGEVCDRARDAARAARRSAEYVTSPPPGAVGLSPEFWARSYLRDTERFARAVPREIADHEESLRKIAGP